MRSSIFVAAWGIFSRTLRILTCAMWDLVPSVGIKPGSLHWECRVIATGSPGKSCLWTTWWTNYIRIVKCGQLEWSQLVTRVESHGTRNTTVTIFCDFLTYRPVKRPCQMSPHPFMHLSARGRTLEYSPGSNFTRIQSMQAIINAQCVL